MQSSERLRFRMAMTNAHLGEALQTLWRSPDLAKLFPDYLILLHQIIRASVPLMEVARSEALKLSPSDPLRQPLADYLAQHIERGKRPR